MIKKTSHQLDVAVIGHSFSAFSAAYHLAGASVVNFRLFRGPGHALKNHDPEETDQPCEKILSSHQDLITRTDHAFGSEKSREYFAFCGRAFNYLQDIMDQNEQNPVKKGKITRLASTDAEKTEIAKAENLFRQAGLETHTGKRKENTVLETGEYSMAVDKRALLEKLLAPVHAETSSEKITHIKELNGEVEIKTSKNNLYTAKFLIIADYIKITELIPFYKTVLLPYRDQFSLTTTDKAFLDENVLCFLKFSQIWVRQLARDQIVFGGARYLRHHTHSPYSSVDDAKVTAHLVNEIQQLFEVKLRPIKKTVPFIGVTPCDELPVIGPHFGSGRILLASGYSGQAISLGIFAGKCLADIILSGRSLELPHFLAPNRLRSL